MTISIRRGTVADVPFLVAVVSHVDVRPFLAAARPTSAAEIEAEITSFDADPTAVGLFVIEREGEAVGTVSF